MKRLLFLLSVPASFLFALATVATPAPANIVPGCLWLADSFPKHYVIKRANVRNAPNESAKIVAVLPRGSVVYTSEETRSLEDNPDRWYAVLPTKDLPSIAGCNAGFVHPSLVSRTPPDPASDTPRPTQAAQVADEGTWVAHATSDIEWGNGVSFASILSSGPTKQKALNAVIDDCLENTRHSESCRRNAYAARTRCVAVVQRSYKKRSFNDLDGADNVENYGGVGATERAAIADARSGSRGRGTCPNCRVVLSQCGD